MHPESEGALEQGAAGRMKATDRGRGLPGHGAVGAQGVVGHQFLGKMAYDAPVFKALVAIKDIAICLHWGLPI